MISAAMIGAALLADTAGWTNIYGAYASQTLRNHMARVYVAEEDRNGNGKVLGYYTLSAVSLGHDELPDDLARRLPKYPVPAVLIGRMASDRRARDSRCKKQTIDYKGKNFR